MIVRWWGRDGHYNKRECDDYRFEFDKRLIILQKNVKIEYEGTNFSHSKTIGVVNIDNVSEIFFDGEEKDE